MGPSSFIWYSPQEIADDEHHEQSVMMSVTYNSNSTDNTSRYVFFLFLPVTFDVTIDWYYLNSVCLIW